MKKLGFYCGETGFLLWRNWLFFYEGTGVCEGAGLYFEGTGFYVKELALLKINGLTYRNYALIVKELGFYCEGTGLLL